MKKKVFNKLFCIIILNNIIQSFIIVDFYIIYKQKFYIHPQTDEIKIYKHSILLIWFKAFENLNIENILKSKKFRIHGHSAALILVVDSVGELFAVRRCRVVVSCEIHMFVLWVKSSSHCHVVRYRKKIISNYPNIDSLGLSNIQTDSRTSWISSTPQFQLIR